MLSPFHEHSLASRSSHWDCRSESIFNIKTSSTNSFRYVGTIRKILKEKTWRRWLSYNSHSPYASSLKQWAMLIFFTIQQCRTEYVARNIIHMTQFIRQLEVKITAKVQQNLDFLSSEKRYVPPQMFTQAGTTPWIQIQTLFRCPKWIWRIHVLRKAQLYLILW